MAGEEKLIRSEDARWRSLASMCEGKLLADGPKFEVLEADLMSRAFDAAISVVEKDGHYLAYPTQ